MKNSQIILPDSGIKLTVCRQAPGVTKNIYRTAQDKHASTKPQPPTQRMEVDEGRFEELPNTLDPDYQKKLQEWNHLVEMEQSVMLVRLALAVGIVRDENFRVCEQKAEELRKVYDTIGMKYDETGDDFVISYVIATTAVDIQFLLFEIFGRSLPEESQVVLRRELFRGNVPQS